RSHREHQGPETEAGEKHGDSSVISTKRQTSSILVPLPFRLVCTGPIPNSMVKDPTSELLHALSASTSCALAPGSVIDDGPSHLAGCSCKNRSSSVVGRVFLAVLSSEWIGRTIVVELSPGT